MDWNIIQNSLSNFVFAILLIAAISYWFNLFDKNSLLFSIGRLSSLLLILKFIRYLESFGK